MAIKTITTLKTDVNSNITTNGARGITGAIHNALLQDILDSCVNRISDVSILGLFDFSSSQTYITGQGVYYDDGGGVKIYRANTDNGPATFNPAEWDEVGSSIYTTDNAFTGNRQVDGAGFSLDFGYTANELSAFNALTSDGSMLLRNNLSTDANKFAYLSLLPNSDSLFLRQSGLNILSFLKLRSGIIEMVTKPASNTTNLLQLDNYFVRLRNTIDSNATFQGLEIDPVTNFYTSLYYKSSYLNVTASSGLLIGEVNGGLGLNYNDRTIDEANIVWATDDNHIPSIGMIKANVGATITDNYIPIGNATNDGIEDGKLTQVDGLSATETEILLNDVAYVTDTIHSLDIKGADTGKTSLNRFYQKYKEDTIINPAHHDGVTGKQTWRSGLYSQDSSFEIWSNNIDSSQRSSGMEFRAEGLSWLKCRLLTTAVISSVNVPILSSGEDVDVILGQYNSSFCTFRTRNNENRMFIGGINSAYNASFSTNLNAYLNLVHSTNGLAEQRPHLLITDGYDETSGLQDGNIWLSSNDSKFYLRNSNSVSIPLEGLKSVISNSQASTATLTIDSNSEDLEVVTALAAAMTIAAPTGTPVEGQKLVIKIKDDGTSRALTWNAIFQVIGTTLPTATTISKWHRIECEYNTTDTKWDVVDVKEQV